MKVTNTKLDGVLIIEPVYHQDYRGYYSEVYSKKTLEQLGIFNTFVQDNHSYTIKKDTIRAIHFQNNPKSQCKLVRCTNGRVLDVVVDLRQDSPTYKQWISVELSKENKKQVYIPHGFGHGFLTLCDDCEVLYKVDQYYDPTLDRAIAWNDPQINILWQVKDPIISLKDSNAPTLKDSDVNFKMEQ